MGPISAKTPLPPQTSPTRPPAARPCGTWSASCPRPTGTRWPSSCCTCSGEGLRGLCAHLPAPCGDGIPWGWALWAGQHAPPVPSCRVSRSPDCKMDILNLSRVFGPTLVGHSSATPTPLAIMEDTPRQSKVRGAPGAGGAPGAAGSSGLYPSVPRWWLGSSPCRPTSGEASWGRSRRTWCRRLPAPRTQGVNVVSPRDPHPCAHSGAGV